MRVSIAFGLVLRKIRTDQKLSQEALAGKCGLDRTFISLLERGERQPSLNTIVLLAAELDISPSLFVAQVEKYLHRAPKKPKS